MSQRAQRLEQRRRELVERSAAQRAALVRAAEPLVRKAAALDRVVAYVRHYPIVTAVAAGAVALLGPRKLLSLGTRLLTLYTLFRQLGR
ncbi:MAG: hypothetical protein A3G28_06420 [Betaproteobacteria bacterium RIFCSPLOWO2_12_FULL_68_19]|nr:MAG: hypothetical protein A3G28_06420 [Betaproteobacteria bacterium RIFCSPLOWO2_12_FULL_68_19]